MGGLGKVRADGKETRAAWRVWGVRAVCLAETEAPNGKAGQWP